MNHGGHQGPARCCAHPDSGLPDAPARYGLRELVSDTVVPLIVAALIVLMVVFAGAASQFTYVDF